MCAFRTLDQVDLKGRRVLLRVDFNVPMQNGAVADATRIERAAPTIAEIADKGGKVILLSHLGRPQGPDPKQSLEPVVDAVSRILARPVGFAPDCIGPKAEAAVRSLQEGDILCLENTRFHRGEEKNDPAFVTALAKLGDIWVNDAFSAAHRAHASTEGLGHRLPAYAGRAMQAEIEALESALEAPQHPVAAIVGGAKISTKLAMLGNLVGKVDILVVGGGMANTFLAAEGKPVGRSLAEHDGPLGAFEAEPFDTGTIEVAEAAAELTDAGKLVSVAGGGDTVAALNAAGVAERFSYVSTAGGAFLEWLEGKTLPGVEVLKVVCSTNSTRAE